MSAIAAIAGLGLKEFSDTEKFMSIGEKLFGEYVWGIYDLLVLPPSFPYGGMENPCALLGVHVFPQSPQIYQTPWC